MTVREAVHLQNNGADADDLRRLVATLSGDSEGIIDAGDLAVTEKSGTPNMSVDVAAGRALILGTQNTLQGTYFFENDAVVNLAVTAADPTNPRKDLVVAEVRDSFYTGGAPDDGRLAIVTGLAAASPVKPALPANSLELNEIDVAAAASSIVNANLNESRVLWVQNRAGSIPNASAGFTMGAWAPTITGWSLGNGTFVGTFCQVGKLVFVRFSLTTGSTTTYGAQLSIPLPVTTPGSLYFGVAGVGWDTSAGVRAPLMFRTTATDLIPHSLATATQMHNAGLTSTVPWTWAAGDIVEGFFTYAAA